MVDSVENIRQQVESARAILEQKKREAQEAEASLEQQRQAIPNPYSQQALRGQKFGGLQGRSIRKQVQNVREDILSKQNLVKEYQGQLGNYEGQVVQGEAELADYQARVDAWDKVQKAAARDQVWAIAAYGEGYEREYAKQWLENDAMAEENFAKQVSEFETANPGERLNVDYGKMRILSVSSDTLGQSLPVDAYNKKIAELNANLKDTSNLDNLNKMQSKFPLNQRDMTFNSQVQSIPPVKQDLFPLASAMEINPITSKPYNTVSEVKPLGQRYKELLKSNIAKEQSGVKGFLTTVGDIASGKIAGLQQKSNQYYQQEGIRNLGFIAPSVAAYSTPIVGEALLIAGGTETFVTAPTEKGKLLGASEAGLGLFGGISRMNINTVKSKIPQTRFYSQIEPLENGASRILTLSETNIGKNKVFGIAGNKVSEINGRNIIYGRNNYIIRPLEKGKTEISRFNLIGKPNEIGPANLVKEGRGLRLKQDFGTGVQSTSVFQDTGKIIRQNRKTIKTVLPTKALSKSSVVGNIKNIDENVFLFSGKEGKGTLRIYKTGQRSLVIKEPNIFGVIKRVTKEPTSDNLFFGSRSSRGTLTKQEKDVIAASVSSLNTAARDILDVPKNIPKQNIFGINAKNIFPFVSGASGKTQIVTKKGNNLSPITGKAIQSEYYGTGQYEKTDSMAMFFGNSKTEQRNQQSNSFFQLIRTRQQVRQVSKNKLGYTQTSPSKTLLGESFNLKSLLKFAQTSKQSTRQRNQQTFSDNFFRSESKPNRSITPIYKPKTVYSTKGGKVVKADVGRYVVFVRRFGTDNIIGEATTLEKAKAMLKANLQSNLGRSGFITPFGSNEKIDVSLGSGFRPSKRERGRQVQESWFSLGSTGERKEIQSARRNSYKQFDWFGGSKRNKSKKKISWW